MRVTKRQLRRIIKEEKTKILREEADDAVAGMPKSDLKKLYTNEMANMEMYSYYTEQEQGQGFSDDLIASMALGAVMTKVAKDQGWEKDSDEIAQVGEYLGTLS